MKHVFPAHPLCGQIKAAYARKEAAVSHKS